MFAASLRAGEAPGARMMIAVFVSVGKRFKSSSSDSIFRFRPRPRIHFLSVSQENSDGIPTVNAARISRAASRSLCWAEMRIMELLNLL